MALTEAEQAVMDHLVGDPGPLQRSGEGAVPASVRFRRCRELPDGQLHAVAFSNREGQPRDLVLRTVRDPGGGWLVHPIGGGGGGHPPRSRPWVNFTAQWNTDMFAGGGDVIGDGAERAHLVRLAFADGTVVEDGAHHEVVLFHVPHGVALPARVEVLDEVGTILAAYDEFANLA